MMTFEELSICQRDGVQVFWLPLSSVNMNDVVPLTPKGTRLDFAIFGSIQNGFYRELPIPRKELYPSLDAVKHEIEQRTASARGNNFPVMPHPRPISTPWADVETRVREAIKDLKEVATYIDCANPQVDKYCAILDAELRLLELRAKVELTDRSKADIESIKQRLAE